MHESEALSRAFESAEQIPFDDSSRIVLISDCHRGDGSSADDFLKNEDIYFAALTHYYDRNYTYIEIGDGDELWENKYFSDIARVHGNVFWLLSRFSGDGRLYSIFGNHDIEKSNGVYRKRYTYLSYYNYLRTHEKRDAPPFDIKYHEGLVLKHMPTGSRIFLVHGHQADFMNYKLWRFSRFLVRYFWKPLELYGINDPTSAAKNDNKKESVEKKLIEWATANNQMLVAGHTHRPAFPEPGEPLYFNDGCCVHPRYITAIEITGGEIALVRWEQKTGRDGEAFIGREVLKGPKKLRDYFEKATG